MESLLVADNIDFRLEYRVRTCAFHAANTLNVFVYLLSVSLSSLSLFSFFFLFFGVAVAVCSLYIHSLTFDAFVSTLFMKRHVDFIHHRFNCSHVCVGGVCICVCVCVFLYCICLYDSNSVSFICAVHSFVRSYCNGYFWL